jgi:glycogen synthase
VALKLHPEENPVVHISLASLEYDARIARSVSALEEAGIPVRALAPGAGLEPAPMTFGRKLRMALAYPLLSVFGEKGASLAFWSFRSNRAALAALTAMRPSLIHAHDWDALPIAAAAARRLMVPFIYDSHEYARAMHRERLLWRLTMSRAIALLERASVREAAGVITVSEGIAGLLQSDHKLPARPVVVRNMPAYLEVPHRPADPDKLTLHYHGVLAAGRGLDAAVKSLAHLPARYHLSITGPERQLGFAASLGRIARELGVEERLAFHPAVDPGRLVSFAARADFGLCILDNESGHNRFALPNKVFEYIMAGLFCITSDGPDMAAIVAGNKAGLVLGDISPQSIAREIMTVSRGQLERTRRANLDTAKRLNWEGEKEKLIRLYRTVLHSP